MKPSETEIPQCPAPPPPTPPRRPLPPGACDTHLHVLGPYARYPLASVRAYTVPEAPLADLERYITTMGFDRVVIAHVSAAGDDMGVTLDALSALGDRARGTMMPPGDADRRAMLELHEKGMRGIRLSGAFGHGVDRGTLEEAARTIGDLPWHVAIWPSSPSELGLLEEVAGDLQVPVVLDHLAARLWLENEGADAAALDRLVALLSGGQVWLKLSGMFRATAASYPWPPLVHSVSRLVRDVPERLLWASDWPHVGLLTSNMPRSHELVDWLDEVGCGEAERRRILVENPAALYGF